MFSEFKSVSALEWKNQIIKDLKGESYENLIWHNENNINIEPFYTSEHLNTIYEPAFVHSDWEVCVKANSSNDAKEINQQFLKQLNSGASSISINVSNFDYAVILNEVQLKHIHSTFYVSHNNEQALSDYFSSIETPEAIGGTLFAKNFSTEEDLHHWFLMVQRFDKFTMLKTTCADVTAYHNQNPHAYYEVAIAFSKLMEQLNYLVEKKHRLPKILVIKTGVSPDYFIQIAKFRAIHRLWNLLKGEFEQDIQLHLVVETGFTHKSISDSYNNLLRSTVESMAAVAGGCTELLVNGFDTFFTINKNLSERMAVNQQLILKEESYLNKMADVACGSYYIETITDALAVKALETFKHFEAQGGYLMCFKNKVFENEITKQAAAKNELVEQQKNIFIGVNKFKNEKESISLPQSSIEQFKWLAAHNPLVNFELNHFFQNNA